MNTMAPQLDTDSYAEFYELRKTASTMTANTVKWMSNNLNYLINDQPDKHSSVSVLSIGSGDGEVDLEFIKNILPYLNSQRLKYHALEPNLHHKKRFLKKLDKMNFDKQVRVSVQSDCLEDFNTSRQYDIVLLIHVLYYFDDPYLAIRRALSRTKPGGQVLIIHQSSVGIPEIQRKHMYELKHNENEIFTADDIKKILDNGQESYRLYHIDARLDVGPCLRPSEVGLKIMSFCMECDLRETGQERLDRLTRSFSELAKIEKDGSSFIYEPLGAFLLNKEKLIEDDDPVDDYRQLAQRFGWTEWFLQRKKQNMRFLDVACGTGRWLGAFMMYVKPHLLNMGMSYDLLDPSKHSMQRLIDRMEECHIQFGGQYKNALQEAELPKNNYDIIWSMHGFYAIPRHDLSSVLKKICYSLNEKGEAFIAQATRKSFYISFYEKFLDAFDRQKQSFTSAEDIAEALNILGLDYQTHTIFYNECIPVDDLAALEHYILKESVNNSFAGENRCEQKIKSKIKVLFDHPELKNYLRSFIKEDMYYFHQEICLFSFGTIQE